MKYKLIILLSTSNAEHNQQTIEKSFMADGYHIYDGSYSFFRVEGKDEVIISSYPVNCTIIESISK